MKEIIMSMIKDAVKSRLGAEYDIRFEKKEKNNGLVLQSIIIYHPGKVISPVIYIDKLLTEVGTGNSSVADAAEEIVNIYMQHNFGDSDTDIDINGIFRKSEILKRVLYKVVGAEKNTKFLESTPHKRFLDLAAVYIMPVDIYSGKGTFTVNCQICETLDISERELDSAANYNTKKRGFLEIPINEVLGELSISNSPVKMWILSNPDELYGASVILYKEYFDRLARKCGDDLYVLPSSIHEVIAVPAGELQVENLRQMVCEINDTEVEAEDVLSRNVYRYVRKNGNLELAK